MNEFGDEDVLELFNIYHMVSHLWSGTAEKFCKEVSNSNLNRINEYHEALTDRYIGLTNHAGTERTCLVLTLLRRAVETNCAAN